MTSIDVVLVRLREILQTADFERETTNSLIKRLSQEFDEDLTQHKKALKAAIHDFLVKSEVAAGAEGVTEQEIQQVETNAAAEEGGEEQEGEEAAEDDVESGYRIPESAWSVRLSELTYVVVRTFSNKAYVDIRKYWQHRETQELKPSKKGICLTGQQWRVLSSQADCLLQGLRDRDEDLVVDLSENRAAVVVAFQGRHYVDVREHYEQDGERLRGQKGIFLDESSMESLVANINETSKALDELVSKLGDTQPAKKAKTEQGAHTTATGSSKDPIKDIKPEPPKAGVIELGDKKRVTISDFKGRQFVDLREWYEKDGELKPGKKGVALPVDAWNKLCGMAAQVTAAADKADESFSEQLAGMKKVSISTFKGKVYVNVREYYEKGGQSMPGQKGLSMRLDQWNMLVAGMDSLNKHL